MARLHLDRLKDRYGYIGEKYRKLMDEIISNNSERVHNSVNQYRTANLENDVKKIKSKEKVLNIPKATELVKPQSIWTRKGAERGQLLTDSLRKKIDTDIKNILSQDKYRRTRGQLTGTLKDQAIRDMGKLVEQTFLNYTKRDKSIGVPKNIKAIASTEIRSVVNQANQEYIDKLDRKNDDIVIKKRWIHNGNVWGSKEYKARSGHKRLHGKTVDNYEDFYIKNDIGQIFPCPYPHHSSLPAGEVIGCNCGVQYTAKKVKA